MNVMLKDYVKHKELDIVIADIRDFINICYESHEKKIGELTVEVKQVRKEVLEEIRKVRLDLQNYQENNSRMLEEIRAEIREIRATNEELKDMNKHILGLISYQEDRLRVVEKKAHTHHTDML